MWQHGPAGQVLAKLCHPDSTGLCKRCIYLAPMHLWIAEVFCTVSCRKLTSRKFWRNDINYSPTHFLACVSSAEHRAAWSCSKTVKAESLATKLWHQIRKTFNELNLGKCKAVVLPCLQYKNNSMFRSLIGQRGFLCEKKKLLFKFETPKQFGKQFDREWKSSSL